MHSQHRLSYLSRQNSSTNYPPSLERKSSFFTCCGFKIDLSHKHSIYSSSADITSRRSTICKSSFNNHHNQNYSPRKSRTYSHSPASLPFYDRSLRNHHTVCLKLIDDNANNNNNHHHSTIRRHSATVVHCFRPLPTTNMNSSMITNSYSPSLRPSISEEKEYSTIETFPQPTSNATVSSTPSPPIITTTNFDNTNANSTQDTIDSTESIQSHSQDEIQPAYIIETC